MIVVLRLRSINLIGVLFSRFGYATALVLTGRVAFLALVVTAGWYVSAYDFGLFMVSLAASQILAIICSLGTGPASQLIISEGVERGRNGRVLGFVYFAVATTLLVTLCATLICVLLAVVSVAYAPQSTVAPILYATSMLLPAMAISALREYLARSFGEVVLTFAPRDVVWAGLLSCIVVWLPASRDHFMVIACALLFVIECTVAVMLWQRNVRPISDGFRSIPLRGYRRWTSRSASLLLNISAGFMFERMDILVVGVFTSLQTAGIYGAASRVAPIVSISQRIIIPIFTPRIARAFASKDANVIRGEIVGAVAMSLLVSLPIYLVVTVFASDIMTIFGNEFVAGSMILMVLAAANLAISFGSTFGAIVSVSKNPWMYAIAIWSVFIPTLAALIVVTPLYGPVAAAYTVSLGIVTYNVCLFALFLKLNGRPAT